MKKVYRPKPMTFKFPFRIGSRSMATGSLNRPGKPSGKTPSIKQFSAMKPGRPKPKTK